MGPFGAGKTSIVEWLDEMVKNDLGKTKPILFISRHSCWGFENSATAIHTMLADAIQQVGQCIDTFHISSLPEAYRQTFSAGGEWIDNVSKLMFGQRDPISQFRSLSDLLIDVNSRLVFVVEDLDRNTSRSFDIQEVLAFLQQLKAFPRLSFVLTGGLTSSRSIDYAKLCDHIEYVKSVDANDAFDFVERVRQHCLDTKISSYVALSEPDTEHRWNPLSGLLLRDFQEYSLPQAVAQLLNTPRALRHALGRTFTTWHELHGEIDWDHLLAVNVLRFGAPECFLFLLRRWDRLRARPSDPKFGQDRIERIRETVVNDWSQTVQNVEWNPSAALEVMGCILPAAKWWLVDKSDTRDAPEPPQGVQYERYWRRVVNDVCDPSDVRDQVLIRAIRGWMESPSVESELVSGICSNQAYSDLWEQLAGRFLANEPDLILLLCQHVLTRIGHQHGTAASDDSQGFGATFRFASRHVSLREENQIWLESRITDAAGISLELVNSLWHCYGTLSRNSILRLEDRERVRIRLIETLRERIVSAGALERILNQRFPYVLYQLVHDPGSDKPVHVGPEPWCWLAPVLLDALRQGSTTVAVSVAAMISAPYTGSLGQPSRVDPNVFLRFFSSEAAEVVELLGDLTDRVQDSDQRQLVNSIVESAKSVLSNTKAGVESS